MFDSAAIVDSLARHKLLQAAPVDLPATITGVADHTDDVVPGALFCAIRGTSVDGHRYLQQARDRGATAFIVSDSTGTSGEIPVTDGRAATALAASVFYGSPAESMCLVGVTGTNGKSTTVGLIRHLLNTDRNVGSIGTLGAYDGAGGALYTEKLTTPGPVSLHKTLAELKRRQTETVVLEVSSHALHQRRLFGVSLQAGVFTNLSRDHLDYHDSWQEYVAAKASMVDLIGAGGYQIVNADESTWSTLPVRPGQRRRTFSGAGRADVWAETLDVGRNGPTLDVRFDDASGTSVGGTVKLPLLGEFNVSNAMGAAATVWALGMHPNDIMERLAAAPQVPGRMESVGSEEYLVLRDYSHTPDALERAARAARPLTPGRLIVLFGCGGDRDRGKRSLMGQIAAAEADVAVVTSDNPRTENPERIIADIEEGMQGKAYVRIVDRREAIQRAVDMMGPHDCLLLAGKGHETYQVLGTERIPFDERELVAEALLQKSAS